MATRNLNKSVLVMGEVDGLGVYSMDGEIRNLDEVPYSDFYIQTRPEIRKGCVWEITMHFSQEAMARYKLREIHLEKPRMARECGAYLCLKVRSKLIQKEIGFSKVAELESEGPTIEPNSTSGIAILKVKFTQRPRAVFHKHADVMVLVVSLRSCTTNEVLLTAEHELIFRGGTGSMHSADSRKKVPSSPTISLYSSTASNLSTPFTTSLESNLSYSSELDQTTSPSLNTISSPSSFNHSRTNSSHINSTTNNNLLKRSLAQLPPADSFASQLSSLIDSRTQQSNLSLRNERYTQPLLTSSNAIQKPIKQENALLNGATPDPFQMEVLPLTLETIQEFQNGLQEHATALNNMQSSNPQQQQANSSLEELEDASLTAIPETANNSYQFDINSFYGDINDDENRGEDERGLTEESSSPDPLADDKELEAWAHSMGLTGTLFPGSTNNDMIMDTQMFNPSQSEDTTTQTSHGIAPQSAMPSTTTQAPEFSEPSHTNTSTTSYTKEVELPSRNQPTTTAEPATPQAPIGAMTRARHAMIRGLPLKRKASSDLDEYHSQHVSNKQARWGSMEHPRARKGLSQHQHQLVQSRSVINHGESASRQSENNSFEDKVFQQLFFRSLSFLSLEELRILAQTAPLPIFVKDEQGTYLLANPAFCSFIYEQSWDSIANRSAEQLLEKDESEKINRADAYIMQREGNIGTFYLSVKHQDFKVMKLFTQLRDGSRKLVVGAVVTF